MRAERLSRVLGARKVPFDVNQPEVALGACNQRIDLLRELDWRVHWIREAYPQVLQALQQKFHREHGCYDEESVRACICREKEIHADLTQTWRKWIPGSTKKAEGCISRIAALEEYFEIEKKLLLSEEKMVERICEWGTQCAQTKINLQEQLKLLRQAVECQISDANDSEASRIVHGEAAREMFQSLNE